MHAHNNIISMISSKVTRYGLPWCSTLLIKNQRCLLQTDTNAEKKISKIIWMLCHFYPQFCECQFLAGGSGFQKSWQSHSTMHWHIYDAHEGPQTYIFLINNVILSWGWVPVTEASSPNSSLHLRKYRRDSIRSPMSTIHKPQVFSCIHKRNGWDRSRERACLRTAARAVSTSCPQPLCEFWFSSQFQRFSPCCGTMWQCLPGDAGYNAKLLFHVLCRLPCPGPASPSYTERNQCSPAVYQSYHTGMCYIFNANALWRKCIFFFDPPSICYRWQVVVEPGFFKAELGL